MMSWLTTSDIEARVEHSLLLDLADDDGDGTPDTDVMSAIRADAEAEVEAQLASRYTVPFTSTDPALVEIASAVAVHRLYLRKGADSPQHVKEAFEAARETLARIARGEGDLPTVAARGDRAQASAEPEDRQFTRETLEDY